MAAIRNAVGRSVTTVTCDDLKFRVDLRDEGVAQTLYRDRSYEPLETRFIVSRLKAGDVFVDVGANIGYYSVNAARIVGPNGLVISVEADPYNFTLLQRNIAMNGGQSNVRPLNIALGRETSTARIYRSGSNFGDHRLYSSGDDNRTSTEVQVRRLDDVLADSNVRRIDFIKIDVQGFEDHVVSGFTGVLASEPLPTILLEFWPWGIRKANGSPEHLLQLFATAGYTAYDLSTAGLKALDYDAIWTRIPPMNPDHPDDSAVNLVFSTERLDHAPTPV